MDATQGTLDAIRSEYQEIERKRRQEQEEKEQTDAITIMAMIDRHLLAPWRQAAMAAGIPGDLLQYCSVRRDENVRPDNCLRGAGNHTWRFIHMELPGAHPIYIIPEDGRPWGMDVTDPTEFTLYVSIPYSVGDWDGDEGAPYYVRRYFPSARDGYSSDSVAYRLEDWREAIGRALTMTEYDQRTIDDAERRNEEYRAKKDTPEPTPPEPREIAMDRSSPDADRLIAAVLYLAEEIQVLRESGLATWDPSQI